MYEKVHLPEKKYHPMMRTAIISAIAVLFWTAIYFSFAFAF